jgi:hypothetical protein
MIVIQSYYDRLAYVLGGILSAGKDNKRIDAIHGTIWAKSPWVGAGVKKRRCKQQLDP